MINFNLNFWHKIKHILLASAVSMSVISCGASIVAAGISGTGIGPGTVFGVITGFGSIFVNGVEYEIDNASFDIDGNTVDNSKPNLGLGIGMVVKLEVDDNGDGTGVATNVFYDDSIEGPVASVIADPSGDLNLKQIVVFGQTVIINATTTTFEGVSFEDDPANLNLPAGVAVGDVVEVSGFLAQDGSILATRVEKRSSLSSGNDVEVELRGTISGLTPDVSFSLAGVTIHITQPFELKDLTALANGQFVEVKGLYQPDGSVIAQEIELEGDSQDDISNSSGAVSLQGFVTTAFNSSNQKLAVNAVLVDASAISSALTSLLVSGLEVEVKGTMKDGELIADKIEIRSAEARFKAQIKSVGNNSIEIGYPSIATSSSLLLNSRSLLVDELGVFKPFTVSNLVEGMEVNVSVVKMENDWVVSTLKRSPLNEYEAEGLVTATTGTNSLTVAGFQIDVSGVSDFEINDVNKTAAQFFAAIVLDSSRVKLEDEDKDGVFDKAELE